MKYEVKYNKTIQITETKEEAISTAMQLIDPSMPWDSVISEIDEDGNHLRIIKRISCNA
jgi:hypothetical protein